MDELQSKEQRDLFDIIDNLRSHGIDKVIDLPEIIVCGDQSAGKSSVLEAISGIPFPTKDGLCTRFVTELVLRRDPVVGFNVSITPGPERSADEADKLRRFGDKTPMADANAIGRVIELAKNEMGLSESKRFSTDVLRVEIAGPDQAHLTMVDLPGLYRAGSIDQSMEGAETVKDMVMKAMRRPRSIILAVVSAGVPFNNQEITARAQEIDPKGLRTLGLITKPDLLKPGSDSEKSYLQLARNEDVVLKLGWHVLKNPDFDAKEMTPTEREKDESGFFKKAPWSSIDASHLGVKALRKRLSILLRNQILRYLPAMIQDVRDRIGSCEETLAKLGDSRGTSSEQRRYLLAVSQKFSILMRAAVEGNYNDGFFGDTMTDIGYFRRLRAVVQNCLENFEEKMRTKGKAHVIWEDEKPNVDNALSRDDYLDRVGTLIKRSRGRELPGTYNPLLIGELFAEQCRNWRAVTQDVKDDVVQKVTLTASEILHHVALDRTEAGVYEIVVDGIEKLKNMVDAKLDELLAPHETGHPITYNHYLTDMVQKAEQRRRMKEVDEITKMFDGTLYDGTWSPSAASASQLKVKINNALAKMRITEPDMMKEACNRLVDYSEAYYKVALKTFIDAFSQYAVEYQLLRQLPSLLTPEMVYDLTDDQIAKLAADDDETVAERLHSRELRQALESALSDLRSLEKHRAAMHLGSVAASGSDDGSDQKSDNGSDQKSDDGSDQKSDEDDRSEETEPGPMASDGYGDSWPIAQVVPAPPEELSWPSFVASKKQKKGKKW